MFGYQSLLFWLLSVVPSNEPNFHYFLITNDIQWHRWCGGYCLSCVNIPDKRRLMKQGRWWRCGWWHCLYLYIIAIIIIQLQILITILIQRGWSEDRGWGWWLPTPGTKHSSHVGAEGFVFVILCRQQCRCRVDSRASLKLKPIRRRPDINEPPLLPANYYPLKPNGIRGDRKEPFAWNSTLTAK